MRFLCILSLLLIAGCYPKNLDYEWGWATHQVSGKLLPVPGKPVPAQSFLVVQQYYSQFIEVGLDKVPLYEPRAQLVFPDDQGVFEFHFDTAAAKFEVFSITPKHQMQTLRFQRQMGVGDIHYQITLIPSVAWKEHLALILQPFLQNLITDPRYGLSEKDQLFLGKWLDDQK